MSDCSCECGGVASPEGVDGSSAFVYIAYADDGVGTGFTNYPSGSTTKPYIAFLHSTTPIANPVAANFVGLWFNRKGINGINGFLITGDIDCSGDPNYPPAAEFDVYRVIVSGRIGGAAGKRVFARTDPSTLNLVGCDCVVAIHANAGGTEAAVGSDWFLVKQTAFGPAAGDGSYVQNCSSPDPLSTAAGVNAIAFGSGNAATGNNSIAGGGTNARATGASSIALGSNALASGANSSVLGGTSSTASGVTAIAAGNTASAGGANAIAFGFSANASGSGAVAIGSGTIASAGAAVAIGETAQATAGGAVAVGGNTASGLGSFATGAGCTAGPGNRAIAIGESNVASGANSVAIGTGCNVSGAAAVGIGADCDTTLRNTLAKGTDALSQCNYTETWSTNRFSAKGDNQTNSTIISALTTPATVFPIFLGFPNGTEIPISSSVAWYFEGTAIAVDTDTEEITTWHFNGQTLKTVAPVHALQGTVYALDTTGAYVAGFAPIAPRLDQIGGGGQASLTIVVTPNFLRFQADDNGLGENIRWQLKLQFQQVGYY